MEKRLHSNLFHPFYVGIVTNLHTQLSHFCLVLPTQSLRELHTVHAEEFDLRQFLRRQVVTLGYILPNED